MNELQVQFGISVIIVNIFHWLRRYIPWVEKETESAIKVVSLTTSLLSSSIFTFTVHSSIFTVNIDMPVLVRFIFNAAIQHGFSQGYHAIVYKKSVPKNTPYGMPVVAGPILSGQKDAQTKKGE